MNYLYDSGDFLVFMDNNTFEQVEIPTSRLEWEKKFLTENLEVEIVTYEDECKLEEEGLKIEVVPVWKWVLSG